MSRFLELIKEILEQKAARRGIIISVGLIMLLFLVECGLNFWIRSGLQRSLVADPTGKAEISSRISWLGLGDILAGKVDRVHVNARDCLVNNLRYSRLKIDSQGFRFDLKTLLKQKRLQIIQMADTRIDGAIAESDLNDYLDFRYPEYNSSIKIKPGRLILTGSAHVFNQIIPIQLEGDLKAVSDKRLRFYPTSLVIANKDISGPLLRIVSEQVPLEFGVMEGWPLQMRDFRLESQNIKFSMEEISAESR